MKTILQHIIFPDDSSLEQARALFYRGDYGRLTEISPSGHLMLAKYQHVEFNTYLNGFSNCKWRRYTPLESVELCLEFSGEAEIVLAGYSLVQKSADRNVLNRQIISSADKKRIVLPFPDTEETVIGFELTALSDFELFGGYYEASYADESVRPVELSLLTTTFKREAYIKKNARRMKEGLFDAFPDIGQHIRMHIVDNGRTLSAADFPNDPEHFLLHPNPNAGGSGGYARGMIECLHQKPEATHGLLLDDDIFILPESLYRTYRLLQFVRPEYQDHMISGAMLMLEDKLKQHEDIGCVAAENHFKPLKPRAKHDRLKDNLRNEKDYIAPDTYQAWWYCCIPVSVIRQYGLPLPLFIRGDDVEYGLRCQSKIISMNGICLWHMGFAGKFSPTLNIYQEMRNLLIDQATTGVLANRDLMGRVHKIYRECLLKHDYTICEFLLRALEDFMKGPSFIMEDRGEQIMKENNAACDKMLPFKEFGYVEIVTDKTLFIDNPRKFISKWLYRLTWNGVYCPDSWLNHEPICIPNDLTYLPGKLAMRKTYIAVDVFNQKACVRPLDKKRFKSLQKRYKKDISYYKKHAAEIQRAYREQRDYLTSEAFWKKYLKLE